MDATYKIVPTELFYQAFILHFLFEDERVPFLEDHVFPALVILMEGKSREDYDAAFELTNELFPEFSPVNGMADCEAASRASAQQQFRGLLVRSCWFHYCQAIIQKIKSLGLIKVFKKNKSFADWVRKLMAVPLLPHYHMEAMYRELLQKTFNFSEDANFRKFRKFKQYMDSYWASKDFTQLSVFGLDRRTNNNCESFHAQYNALVSEKHPGLYDFADYTNEMLENYLMDFEKLLTNPEVPINRPRRAALDSRDGKLKQYERLLIGGDLTPMEFIEKNCHSSDGIIGKYFYFSIANFIDSIYL